VRKSFGIVSFTEWKIVIMSSTSKLYPAEEIILVGRKQRWLMMDKRAFASWNLGCVSSDFHWFVSLVDKRLFISCEQNIYEISRRLCSLLICIDGLGLSVAFHQFSLQSFRSLTTQKLLHSQLFSLFGRDQCNSKNPITFDLLSCPCRNPEIEQTKICVFKLKLIELYHHNVHVSPLLLPLLLFLRLLEYKMDKVFSIVVAIHL
jgi:hypothetical protein